MYLMLESLLMRLGTLPWDMVQRYPLTSPNALPFLAPTPLAAFTSVVVGGLYYCTTTFTVVPQGTACTPFDIYEDCAAIHAAVRRRRSRRAGGIPHMALRVMFLFPL